MNGDLVTTLLGWLPMVVILGAYVLYFHRIRRATIAENRGNIDRLETSNREVIAELREIKQILKDRA